MTDKELLQRALDYVRFYNPEHDQEIRAELHADLRERLAREDEPWEQFFPDIGKAFNAGVLEGVMRERAYWDKQEPSPSPSRRKGAHWTEDYPDSPVLDDFPVTQPARQEQENLYTAEKTSTQQPHAEKTSTQEPVAWKQTIRSLTEQCAALIRERDDLQKQVWLYEKNGVTCQTYRHTVAQSCAECNVQMNYTTPQREWVGLTEGDLQPIADEYRILFGGWVHDFARAIEAKLKERNT